MEFSGATLADRVTTRHGRRNSTSAAHSASSRVARHPERTRPILAWKAAIAPRFALAPREYIATIRSVFHSVSLKIVASDAPSSTRSWVAPIRAEWLLIQAGSKSGSPRPRAIRLKVNATLCGVSRVRPARRAKSSLRNTAPDSIGADASQSPTTAITSADRWLVARSPVFRRSNVTAALPSAWTSEPATRWSCLGAPSVPVPLF